MPFDNKNFRVDTKTEYGYKSYIYCYPKDNEPTCPQCGKQFNYYVGEVQYIYEGITFCSWTCKCRFKKSHPVSLTSPSPKPDLDEEDSYALKAKKNNTTTKQVVLNEIYQLFPDVPKKLLYKKKLPELKQILKDQKLPEEIRSKLN